MYSIVIISYIKSIIKLTKQRTKSHKIIQIIWNKYIFVFTVVLRPSVGSLKPEPVFAPLLLNFDADPIRKNKII